MLDSRFSEPDQQGVDLSDLLDSAQPVSNLQVALDFAARGFKVFPITKKVHGNWTPIQGWQSAASADERQIRAWFKQWSDARLGLPTGRANGLCALDLDEKGGKSGARALEAIGFAWKDASPVQVQTPSGGRHILFSHDPDLRNWVGKIGDGVDVRAEGGYILAPGSWKNGRQYRSIGAALGSVELPAWPAALKPKLDAYNAPQIISDATEAQRKWALEHLKSLASGLAEMGINSGRNDALNSAATWAGGAAAHGLISREDTETILGAACERNGLDDREFAATFASGWKGGLSKPITNVPFDVDDADFEDLPDLDPSDLTKGMIAYDTYKLDLTGDYLVKGVLDQGTVSVMYGASNSGKTFAALDIAHHIARGASWRGLRVKQASVLYLSMEGGERLMRRVEVLKRLHPGSIPHFHVWPRPVDFRSKDAVAEAIRRQRHIAGLATNLPQLVIVDTVARAMPGADENAVKDMSMFVAAVDRIKSATGAHVMLIHHSGKDEARGMRGSSALLAAIDHELHVQCDHETGDRVIMGGKQRDHARDTDGFHFRLVAMDIGIDVDGDPVTSCFCEATGKPIKSTAERLSRPARVALEVLRALDRAARDVWRDHAVQRDDLCASPDRASRRKAFDRAVVELTEKRMIERLGDLYRQYDVFDLLPAMSDET